MEELHRDEEIELFAEDLYRFVLPRRLNVIVCLPETKSPKNLFVAFHSNIGISVLCESYRIQKAFFHYFSRNYPVFIQNDRAFFLFCIFTAIQIKRIYHDDIVQASVSIASMILELCAFCHLKGYLKYKYWAGICFADIFRFYIAEEFFIDHNWSSFMTFAEVDVAFYTAENFEVLLDQNRIECRTDWLREYDLWVTLFDPEQPCEIMTAEEILDMQSIHAGKTAFHTPGDHKNEGLSPESYTLEVCEPEASTIEVPVTDNCSSQIFKSQDFTCQVSETRGCSFQVPETDLSTSNAPETEYCISEVTLNEPCTSEVTLNEPCTSEVTETELCTSEILETEACISEVLETEACTTEVFEIETCTSEDSELEVCTVETCINREESESCTTIKNIYFEIHVPETESYSNESMKTGVVIPGITEIYIPLYETQAPGFEAQKIDLETQVSEAGNDKKNDYSISGSQNCQELNNKPIHLKITHNPIVQIRDDLLVKFINKMIEESSNDKNLILIGILESEPHRQYLMKNICFQEAIKDIVKNNPDKMKSEEILELARLLFLGKIEMANFFKKATKYALLTRQIADLRLQEYKAIVAGFFPVVDKSSKYLSAKQSGAIPKQREKKIELNIPNEKDFTMLDEFKKLFPEKDSTSLEILKLLDMEINRKYLLGDETFKSIIELTLKHPFQRWGNEWILSVMKSILSYKNSTHVLDQISETSKTKTTYSNKTVNIERENVEISKFEKNYAERHLIDGFSKMKIPSCSSQGAVRKLSLAQEFTLSNANARYKQKELGEREFKLIDADEEYLLKETLKHPVNIGYVEDKICADSESDKLATKFNATDSGKCESRISGPYKSMTEYIQFLRESAAHTKEAKCLFKKINLETNEDALPQSSVTTNVITKPKMSSPIEGVSKVIQRLNKQKSTIVSKNQRQPQSSHALKSNSLANPSEYLPAFRRLIGLVPIPPTHKVSNYIFVKLLKTNPQFLKNLKYKEDLDSETMNEFLKYHREFYEVCDETFKSSYFQSRDKDKLNSCESGQIVCSASENQHIGDLVESSSIQEFQQLKKK